MAEEIAVELAKLRESIDKQNELQDDANKVMRTLIAGLRALAQEIADSHDPARP
jgi:hypothetical protein